MDLYRLRPKRQKSKQKLKLDKLNQDSLDPFESEDDALYDVQKILTQVDKNQKWLITLSLVIEFLRKQLNEEKMFTRVSQNNLKNKE